MSVNRSKANQPRFWGIWHQSGAVSSVTTSTEQVDCKVEEVRKFHLGDILSVMYGPIVSPTALRGIQDLLEYLTGSRVNHHDMGTAGRACIEHLKSSFPSLVNEEIPLSMWRLSTTLDAVCKKWRNTDSFEEAVKDCLYGWLAAMAAKYGEMFPVHPLPRGAFEEIDPIESLAQLRGGYDNIVVI